MLLKNLEIFLARGVFRTHSNIYDGIFSENNERLLAVNNFWKKMFFIDVWQGPKYALWSLFCLRNNASNGLFQWNVLIWMKKSWELITETKLFAKDIVSWQNMDLSGVNYSTFQKQFEGVLNTIEKS